MQKIKSITTACLSLSLFGAISQPFAAETNEEMSFFITSQGSGDGGNIGGLVGADAHCLTLAEDAGSTGKVWKAYLSTSGNDAVNARDRIGTGPWFNAKGIKIADNIEHLHSDEAGLGKENSLDEKGEAVNGKGDKPNKHDILTGSDSDGIAIADTNLTCNAWTSAQDSAFAQVGHHDLVGGGPNPTQWNSAHKSKGCSLPTLQSTGGNGLFYCFAEN